MNYKGGEDH